MYYIKLNITDDIGGFTFKVQSVVQVKNVIEDMLDYYDEENSDYPLEITITKGYKVKGDKNE